jgi:hypothetical protein
MPCRTDNHLEEFADAVGDRISARRRLGYPSNGIIPHRRVIFLLPYKPALNERAAQSIGLSSIQEPINFGGSYSRALPDQRKGLFQVAALADRLRCFD